jgi:hypothetical protein
MKERSKHPKTLFFKASERFESQPKDRGTMAEKIDVGSSK